MLKLDLICSDLKFQFCYAEHVAQWCDSAWVTGVLGEQPYSVASVGSVYHSVVEPAGGVEHGRGASRVLEAKACCKVQWGRGAASRWFSCRQQGCA